MYTSSSYLKIIVITHHREVITAGGVNKCTTGVTAAFALAKLKDGNPRNRNTRKEE